MSRLPDGRLPPLALTHLAPGLGVVPVRSPTLPPATHTNCWVLGEDEVVVVDPASPWTDQQDGLVAALGHRRVAAVLLTHHHADHVSGARDLVERTGAPLWAHAETAARVALPVDRLLSEGDRLDLGGPAWRVLHTPGHAQGHLCLHREADGELVAGDMVAGEGTILLDPPEGVLADYLDSLDRLRALAPARLLPAHGPVLADAVGRLEGYVAHRHARTDQVRRGLAGGPATPLELAAGIYPALPSPFLQVAVRQVLCHLHWLADRGEAAPLDEEADGANLRWALQHPSELADHAP